MFTVTKIVTFASKFIVMSTKEKLIKRFMRQPKDFTWDELVRLFGIFGFETGFGFFGRKRIYK